MKITEITEGRNGDVPVYYFAYGMLTDPQIMQGLHLVGVAELPNFEFKMYNWANVEHNPGSKVLGCLWAIDRQEIARLDQAEVYPSLYDRRTYPVYVDGNKVAAEVYIMTPSTLKQQQGEAPSRGYVARVVRGYSNAGIPLTQLEQAIQVSGIAPDAPQHDYDPSPWADEVDEALQSFDTVGDMSQQGQAFPSNQAQWATSQAQQLKTQKFFEKTPYNFRILVSNIKPPHLYNGPVNQKTLAQFVGADAAATVFSNTADSINVVLVGNNAGLSNGAFPLTPWIMAHRFGHMMNHDKVMLGLVGNAYEKAHYYMFNIANKIFVECYNMPKPGFDLLSRNTAKIDFVHPINYYNLLWNAIGTMRSARTGRSDMGEFRHEMFAQYIQSGAITFNPLPAKLGEMQLKPNAPDYLTPLAATMSKFYEKQLGRCVGRVFMMTSVTGEVPSK